MKPRYDIFLSHNSADKAWTELLASRIEADKTGPALKVFFDKWDIKPGGDVPLELEEGLQASHYVGLVLSPEALASDWVSLERSTALYRDPRSRRNRLIPLLRRTCDIPDMLGRLKYIDFRRDQDFEDGLLELLRVIRGRPAKRGGEIDMSDVHFREDADLLNQHRKIFERPAFGTTCIMELFLGELVEAIDDTTAAINTGSLYSRSGKHLSFSQGRDEYRTAEFKRAFTTITQKLSELKRIVVNFEEVFRTVKPDYSHHRNFYAMLSSLDGTNKDGIRQLVSDMDQIDTLRNAIIEELNALLTKSGIDILPKLELSSSFLKPGRMYGMQKISTVLNEV